MPYMRFTRHNSWYKVLFWGGNMFLKSSWNQMSPLDCWTNWNNGFKKKHILFLTPKSWYLILLDGFLALCLLSFMFVLCTSPEHLIHCGISFEALDCWGGQASAANFITVLCISWPVTRRRGKLHNKDFISAMQGKGPTPKQYIPIHSPWLDENTSLPARDYKCNLESAGFLFFFAHTKLEAFDNVYGPNQVTL